LGTELLDINEQSRIVGRIVGRIDFQTPGSRGLTSFAFWISLTDALLGRAGPASAFNVLATPPAGLPKGSLFHAHCINDRNQIVGIYKDAGLASMYACRVRQRRRPGGVRRGGEGYVATRGQSGLRVPLAACSLSVPTRCR
jgi:hypothetical protein